MPSLCCCSGFGLAAANGGYSLVAVVTLLTAVTPLPVDAGSKGAQAQELRCEGSVVVVPRC